MKLLFKWREKPYLRNLTVNDNVGIHTWVQSPRSLVHFTLISRELITDKNLWTKFFFPNSLISSQSMLKLFAELQFKVDKLKLVFFWSFFNWQILPVFSCFWFYFLRVSTILLKKKKLIKINYVGLISIKYKTENMAIIR